MKTKKFKLLLLTIVFLFFLSIPFLQSFLFSTQHEGVISVNKSITADFIKSDKKVVLVFFGYVGCEDVCMPFLTQLSAFYNSKEFASLKDNVEIFFVNLTPEIEPSQVEIFAKYFHEDFRGIYLSKQELYKIDRKFSMFFSNSLENKHELNHTDYLYLISKENNSLILKNFYSTHPLEKKKLIHDIIGASIR